MDRMGSGRVLVYVLMDLQYCKLEAFKLVFNFPIGMCKRRHTMTTTDRDSSGDTVETKAFMAEWIVVWPQQCLRKEGLADSAPIQ